MKFIISLYPSTIFFLFNLKSIINPYIRVKLIVIKNNADEMNRKENKASKLLFFFFFGYTKQKL